MNSSEFHELALRVTEGTASPTERATFDEALRQRPEWREDWLALRRELAAMREAVSDATDLVQPAEKIPAHRLDQLLGTQSPPVKVHGQKWPWLAGALAAAAGVALVFWLQPDRSREPGGMIADAARVGFAVPAGGTITIEAPGRHLVTNLPAPLFGNETLIVADGREAVLVRADGTSQRIRGHYETSELSKPTTTKVNRWITAPLALLGSESGLWRGGGQIQIHSPRGATAWAEPVLAWTAEPGRTYDVELRDALHPEAPPARATGVVSPLPFAQLGRPPLQTGDIYELRVAETDRPTTVATGRFVVLPPPAAPGAGADHADLVAAVLAALASSPARTGDAWLLLQQLPADWRESELGRRLALAVTAN
jgi:hypothetical protein